MKRFTRITLNPEIMGGKPCILGMRVTVGLVSAGYTTEQICQAYPYVESDDISEALAFDNTHNISPYEERDETAGFQNTIPRDLENVCQADSRVKSRPD